MVSEKETIKKYKKQNRTKAGDEPGNCFRQFFCRDKVQRGWSDLQEHEYKARDKTVQKMSRDGLREENLRNKEEKRITGRDTDTEISRSERKMNWISVNADMNAERRTGDGTAGAEFQKNQI